MKMASMQGWFISHLTWCGTAVAWPSPPAPWAAGTRWLRTSSPGTPPSWRPPGCRCSGSTGWPSWRSETPKVTPPISKGVGMPGENSCTLPLELVHSHPKGQRSAPRGRDRAEAYLVHGVHQLGEVVEELGAPRHALLPLVDGFGQLPDVALAHLVKGRLALQSLQWHCRRVVGGGERSWSKLVELRTATLSHVVLDETLGQRFWCVHR